MTSRLSSGVIVESTKLSHRPEESFVADCLPTGESARQSAFLQRNSKDSLIGRADNSPAVERREVMVPIHSLALILRNSEHARHFRTAGHLISENN